jgi:N-acetylmuramoyl-L-alanine amidase
MEEDGAVTNIVKFTDKEIDLLARLIRAEAIGEGELGMLMVGNVLINRVLANCLTFKNIVSIYDAIYQSPGGFAGTTSPLFYSSPTANDLELAKRVIGGEAYYPATNALWFYAPAKNSNCVTVWFDQQLAGRYKNHCFYKPYAGVCKQLY